MAEAVCGATATLASGEEETGEALVERIFAASLG